MNKYLTALKNKVCSVCVDSDHDGICRLSEHEVCAVEKYHSQIVEVVHSVDSEDLQEYISALRKNICTLHCRMNEENNYCYLREDANCALDRHFPLIIETIQQVDKYDLSVQ